MTRSGDNAETAVNRVTRLLARAKDGNTIARDELVDSVYQRLNGLCQAIKCRFPGVNAYEQTGDVMGQVWPKLLRELSQKEFRDSSHFFSFSAVLIRNVLIDLLRKYYGKNGRGAREIDLGSNHDDQQEDSFVASLLEGKDTNSPDRDVMRQEVHSIIGGLEPKDQEMFNFRFYHGLREAECAEALGVDVRTVRRRWRSARSALARALKGEGLIQ